MSRLEIHGGLVLDESFVPAPRTVVVEDGVIAALLPPGTPPQGEVLDAAGCYVLPGLCDIHLHGAMGHDLCDGDDAALDAITAFEAAHGVTVVCPTTMTLPPETLSRVLKNAAKWKKASHPGHAVLGGIHMEGPFLSPERFGAQDPQHLRTPDADLLRGWLADSDGLVRTMTIAPELPGAAALIGAFPEVRFSIGHTVAGYDAAMRAFSAGADRLTHLYNAMPPLLHRAPGPIGAGMDAGAYAELICDGVHVDGAAVRAAFRLFGAERVVLVSDSMEAAGMPDGTYQLGGQAVTVRGTHATLADGTLAGSVTPLYEGLRTAVRFGIALGDAVRAASRNACRAVGLDETYGSIVPGKAAHLLLASADDLALREVVIGAPLHLA